MAVMAASIFVIPGPSRAQPASAPPPRGQLSDFDRKTYITNPAWAATPSADDLFAAYKAYADGKSGSVVMDCPVLDSGLFGQCRLVAEVPEHQGLAEAAFSLIPKFQMKPADAGGKPVAGRTMRVSLKFAPVS